MASNPDYPPDEPGDVGDEAMRQHKFEKEQARLRNELGDGEKAAWLMARHLQRMSSRRGMFRVRVDGMPFEITVEMRRE